MTKKAASTQYERFLEAAREAEADQDGSAADAIMRRLGQTPPEPKVKAAKSARRRGRSETPPKS